MNSKFSGQLLTRSALVFALVTPLSVPLSAQTPTDTASLYGQVLDPSGAVIPDATITLSGPDSKNVEIHSNKQGQFEAKGLKPGNYIIVGVAKGFSTYTKDDLTLEAGQNATQNIILQIATETQQVTVEADSQQVSVDPSGNSSSTVIKGEDLDALSDDPDELQGEIDALAGPSTGPNGGQIYIDGFTGGQLPPKSSIREIRINQNPFSAEYDRPGYGRVEVFTKPGTDNYHGQFYVLGNTSAFNTATPFAPNEPDYHSVQYNGSVGGPLGKKVSFFFNIERRNIDELAFSNPQTGQTTDANGNAVSVFTPQLLPNPRTRTNVSPRLDYQLTDKDTVTARYQFLDSKDQNDLPGQLALASQAYNTSTTEHTAQLSETHVFGTKVVNETRFQYLRDNATQMSLGNENEPTINVLSAFTGGPNNAGNSLTTSDHYELQNYTSIAQGNHFLRFGGRLRDSAETQFSTENFNGNYTFSNFSDYLNTISGVPGFGPRQFTINTGNPTVSNNYVDVGLYAEDDWKVRQNLTLSLGLRYETQGDIGDHNDWAPRIGIAYGIGRAKNGPPKTVLRVGYGIFYDRFTQDLLLNAERQNGVNQREFVVSNPSFPNPPSVTTPADGAIRSISPNLRSPYTMQTAVGVERQLGRIGTLSATYINARGVHQLISVNINAPVPGAPGFPNNQPGAPAGILGNLYQYESEGIFKQNQLIVNPNLRLTSKLTMFGYYSLNFANANTAGANTFPTDQYNLALDYGRTAFDVRHRLFIGGSWSLPHYFRLSPFLVAQSGTPFNITTGQDLDGSSIFNDRPGFANQGTGPVVNTSLGSFNLVPVLGGPTIPTYYGTGPASVSFNMRASKTWGFGSHAKRGGAGDDAGGGNRGGGHGGGNRGGGRGTGGGGGSRGMGGMFGGSNTDQRYNLTFSVNARDLFNNVNYGVPNGNLSNLSTFGHSTSLAGGPFGSQLNTRRIDLQLLFSF